MNRRTAIGRIGLAALAGAVGPARPAPGGPVEPHGGDDEPPSPRELEPRPGYEYEAFTVALSPDGSVVASGGEEWGEEPLAHAAWLWDARTGQRLHRLAGGDNPILDVAFNPSGGRVAAAGVARILARMAPPPIPGADFYIGSVRYSWDGGIAFVVGTATGRLLHRCSASDHSIIAVGFGQRYVATIDNNYVLRLCDAATGREVLAVTELEGQGQGGRYLGRKFPFCSDASRAAALSDAFDADRRFGPPGGRIGDQRLVKLWDTRGSRPVARTFWLPGPIATVAMSPDGSRFATGVNTLQIVIYDFETCAEVLRIEEPPEEGFSRQVVWSPDGRRIAYVGDGGLIRIWDAETGHRLKEVRVPEPDIRAIAFLPEERLRVVCQRPGREEEPDEPRPRGQCLVVLDILPG